jgi:hypothetical protein
MSAKTEVYSWRLSPTLKSDLEDAARVEGRSMAELLDRIAREWLARSACRGTDDQEIQRRLRASATRAIGAFDGGDPDRAANAPREVRQRLARRRA